MTDMTFTEAIEKAVELKGEDYVYPMLQIAGGRHVTDDYHSGSGNCVYATPDGTPACIMGVAFDLMGLPVPPYDDGDASIIQLLNDYGIKDQATKFAAAAAQNAQDAGRTWGEALATYKARYAEEANK